MNFFAPSSKILTILPNLLDSKLLARTYKWNILTLVKNISAAGTNTLRIGYGLDTQSTADPLIELNERVVEALEYAAVPGKWLVVCWTSPWIL
jgi:hypothetical protein